MPNPSLEQRFAQTFNTAFAADHHVIYQFAFDSEDAEFHVEIANGACQFSLGRHSMPTLTMLFDRLQTVETMLAGKLDRTAAFMDGRIRSDSHLILALQLGAFFSRTS